MTRNLPMPSLDYIYCPYDEEYKNGYDCLTCNALEFVFINPDPTKEDILKCTVTERLVILRDPGFD